MARSARLSTSRRNLVLRRPLRAGGAVPHADVERLLELDADDETRILVPARDPAARERFGWYGVIHRTLDVYRRAAARYG